MPKKRNKKNSNNKKNINSSNNIDKQQELHYQNLHERKVHKTLRVFFVCVSFPLCIYFLAGKTTITSLSAIVSTSTETVSIVYKFIIVILVIIAIGAVIWAYLERRAKNKKVIKLSKRIVKLEKMIDPNRSSSYLNKDGSTRKEDKHDV